MKFTVRRSEWYRGRPKPKLLNEDGMRCCIGFVGQQCGISDEQLLGRNTVLAASDFNKQLLERWPKWLRNPRLAGDAYDLNDGADFSDQERESRLKQLFAQHDDEIEFVD